MEIKTVSVTDFKKYFISQLKDTQITLTEVAIVSSTLNTSFFAEVFSKVTTLRNCEK